MFGLESRKKLAISISGAVLAGTQVLLIRRALALAGGDEVVFALTLTVWLLCVACGSAVGSRLVVREEREVTSFSVGLLLLSFSAPLGLLLLHEVSFLSHWVPGTVPGGGGMVLSLSIALFPIGLIGGALFPIGCRMLAPTARDSVGLVYLLEAAGSFAAGTATALIFAPHIGGLTLAVLFALLGMSVAVTLLKPKIPLIPAVVMSLIIGVFLSQFIHRYDARHFAKLRQGMQVHEVLETPYGLIEITERHGQITLYENGLLLAISDDLAGAEERAHFSLVQHASPRDVLWIGGSLGGGVEEALRHPSLERLDLVELNPILFDLTKWLDSEKDSSALTDPRVRLYRQDGRRFLSRVHSGTYDLITLNLPGPRTARLAKFYSVQAFRLCRQALKSNGALVFSVASAEDYIGEDLAALLASLYGTLEEVFEEATVLPGENAIFVAGNRESHLVTAAEDILARFEERDIEPLYWDKYRIRDRLSESRIDIVSNALTSLKNVRFNRDETPICFYLQQVLWSQQVRGGLPRLLKALKNILLPSCLALLCVGALIAILLRRFAAKKRAALGSGWAVMTVGLAGISIEVLALITYQVHFGSGYREVGLLVGFYMAGLSLGAALSRRIKEQRRRFFRMVQVVWVVIPAGLILFILFSKAIMTFPVAIGASIFFVYLLAVGALGGLHFPLAVTYSGEPNARRAGILYSFDLVGSAAGGLVVGLLASPLLGITVTALGLMLINLLPLILLVGNDSRSV